MFRAFVVIWMVVMIMAGLSFTDRGTRIAEAAMGVVFSGTAQSPWRAFGDNMGSDGVFLATGAEPSTPGVVTLAGMQAVSKAVIHKIPDEDLYEDELFRRYCEAKAKINLGRILSIYEFNLPGGVRINFDGIKQDGHDEMTAILEQIDSENTPDWFFQYHI